MKRIARMLSSAAVVAALTLGTSGLADSAVFTPGPQDLPSLPGNGFPKWYTDPVNAAPPPAGGLSLSPCLSQTPSPTLLGPMCVLLPDAGFIPTNPIVFPTNFPDESFYAIADAIILDIGAGNRARYRANLEAAFNAVDANGIPILGQQITFARVRWTIDAPVNGTYRITHPFGRRVFTNVIAGPQAIRIQEDVGIGAPGGPFGNIVTPDQPDGNLGQFLIASATPGGQPRLITIGNEIFIGDPNIDQAVTGATFPDPDVPGAFFNSFMVEIDAAPTDGVFEGRFRTDNFNVAGQIIGLTLTPPAGGTDFGIWKINTPSTAKTFTLQNLSPAAITPAITAIVPNSNNVPSPDFSIVPSTCGAAVPAGASCTFDVIFNTPTTAATSATITVSGGASVPPVQTTVSGTGDGIAPTLTIPQVNLFTKTTSATISGTATDNVGIPIVRILNGATLINEPTVSLADGAWTFSPTVALNTATTFTVTTTDNANPLPGNPAANVNVTITSDNQLPAVSITAPAAGLTNNNNPTLSFTANDTLSGVSGTAVKLDTNPTPICTANCNNLSLGSPVALPDGSHTVIVEATDAAGNIGSNTTTFTVDTISPAITVSSPSPFNGRLGISNPVLTFSVNDANLPVNTVVRRDTVTVPNPVSGVTTLGPYLSGESHNITVESTDPAGNITTNSVTFVIDFHDGRISSLGVNPPTIADALLALRHTVGLTTLVNEAFDHANVAPLNAQGIPAPDSVVNIADALIILRRVVGLINTF